MGQNKNAAIGFGVLAVIIAIIVGVVLVVTNTGETKSAEQDKTAETQELSYMERFEIKEKEVLDLVKDYKGKGNSDMTLGEAIAMAVLVAYPNEKILDNPSTEFGWSALPVDGNPDKDKSWNAKFYLKTYKEDTSFEWIVDMEAKTIYPKNENGKSILDLLED
jgi:hypothetical protein